MDSNQLRRKLECLLNILAKKINYDYDLASFRDVSAILGFRHLFVTEIKSLGYLNDVSILGSYGILRDDCRLSFFSHVPYDEKYLDEDVIDLIKSISLIQDKKEIKEAISELSEAMLDYVDLDGSRHRHRVLGNVYEQILAMTPTRKGDRIELRTSSDKNKKKNDRSTLGAHYTPAELVEEVVRPALGHLFRQIWEEVSHNIDAYITKIKKLKVVDPAMGSGHFLTLVALEIAREVAWCKLNSAPRFVRYENWDEPLIHKNSIGDDPTPDDTNQTNTAIREDVYGGAGDEADFETLVREHLPDIIRECIYGVDINPLACELGKLAIWLFELSEKHDTATAASNDSYDYPPLTYLDSNIRCGDSLVGFFLDDVDNVLKKSVSALDSHGTLDLFQQRKEGIEERVNKIKALREAINLPNQELQQWVETNPYADALHNHSISDNPFSIRKQINIHCRELLAETSWLFDLALLLAYYNYSSRTSAKTAQHVHKALYENKHAAKSAKDITDTVEKKLANLLRNPFDSLEDNSVIRGRVQTYLKQSIKLKPFHWELEFADVFMQGGFDLITANPPFIGSQNAREHLGDTLDLLAHYFFAEGKKREYAGYFFLRYAQILNQSGVVGTIAPNTIAQGANRQYILKPLLTEKEFQLTRVVPNNTWPGDANVHYSLAHFVRQRTSKQFYTIVVPPNTLEESDNLMPRNVPILSSHFDEYPEFEPYRLASLPSDIARQGFILRGNFSIHRQPGQSLEDALLAIPKNEHDALAAYLNNRAVQQNAIPTPDDVVIDFYEPIKNAQLENASAQEQKLWLDQNYPILFKQLQNRSPHEPDKESVFEQRRNLSSSSSNDSHKEFWWLFGSTGQGLRQAWENADKVYAFGAVGKIWSPACLHKGEPSTKLRICPTHSIFISPIDSTSWFGILASFPFEMLVRRLCSTLKSDLRFTPTEVFPYFPVPWLPTFDTTEGKPVIFPVPDDQPSNKNIGDIAQRLLDLRTALLTQPAAHGIDVGNKWGPTELYNLYDNPEVDIVSIEELRQLHVELFQAVVRAYGWDDIASTTGREAWNFERPWIDRTMRFVPPEPIRREIYQRFNDLNHERYEYELNLYRPYILELLSDKRLTTFSQLTKAATAANINISDDDLRALMELCVNDGIVQLPQTDGKKDEWKLV